LRSKRLNITPEFSVHILKLDFLNKLLLLVLVSFIKDLVLVAEDAKYLNKVFLVWSTLPYVLQEPNQLLLLIFLSIAIDC
jgi:hypothetical protein